MNIIEAGSVEHPSKFCILNKGYEICQTMVADLSTGEELSTHLISKDKYIVRASKIGCPTFEAFSYISLLGLIAMWEIHGDSWLSWSSEDKIYAKRGYTE